MIWASVVLVPLALVADRPWTLSPSATALAVNGVLSILCIGVALVIYFRLVETLGSVGVARQSYLRAGFGVILDDVALRETFTLTIGLGLLATIAGVAVINWPRK
jgi:drug/metabolite transporter (DMT)-like permease